MKRSGRTLKQRLYGLKHIASRLRRARYFRGHGVHSPYVYNIVRQVFMSSKFIGDDRTLYDALVARGTSQRRAMQLQNLALHCNYATWSIDAEGGELVILTLDCDAEALVHHAEAARTAKATLCILTPYHTAERWQTCCSLVEGHPSTTVDNRGYLLLFNNHLPKQRFRL